MENRAYLGCWPGAYVQNGRGAGGGSSGSLGAVQSRGEAIWANYAARGASDLNLITGSWKGATSVASNRRQESLVTSRDSHDLCVFFQHGWRALQCDAREVDRTSLPRPVASRPPDQP